MFRSALVALRPDAPNEPLLDYAVQLAQRYSLHLSGTSILDRDLISPPEAVPLGGMAFKVELDEARIARVREQMESTIGEFERHCTAAGVAFDVACSADALCPQISRAAQRHDVLLLGHTEELTPSGPRRDAAALQQILQQCPGGKFGRRAHSSRLRSARSATAGDGRLRQADDPRVLPRHRHQATSRANAHSHVHRSLIAHWQDACSKFFS